MMALHVGLRRPKPMAAIVGFSGMLVEPDRLKADIRSRPPVMLIHGDADEVIPVEALHQARAALARRGLPSNGMSAGTAARHRRRGAGNGGAFSRRRLSPKAPDASLSEGGIS